MTVRMHRFWAQAYVHVRVKEKDKKKDKKSRTAGPKDRIQKFVQAKLGKLLNTSRRQWDTGHTSKKMARVEVLSPEHICQALVPPIPISCK